jgi:uncharacterized DUF497 family protein
MMNLRATGFDWDGGNRAKCQRHGVSIAEIEALFMGTPRIAPDPKHSEDEDRMIAWDELALGCLCLWHSLYGWKTAAGSSAQ